MRIPSLGLIAALGLWACDNAQPSGVAQEERFSGSCAFSVENALAALHSFNNPDQPASEQMKARFAQIGKSQCGCAQRALSADDYAALNPEVTTTQEGQGQTMASLQESEASAAASAWREKVNGALRAQCPGEPV